MYLMCLNCTKMMLWSNSIYVIMIHACLLIFLIFGVKTMWWKNVFQKLPCLDSKLTTLIPFNSFKVWDRCLIWCILMWQSPMCKRVKFWNKIAKIWPYVAFSRKLLLKYEIILLKLLCLCVFKPLSILELTMFMW